MIQIWKNGARPEFWEDEYAVIAGRAWQDLIVEAKMYGAARLRPMPPWQHRFIEGLLAGVGPWAMRPAADGTLTYAKIVDARQDARQSQALQFGLGWFRKWVADARARFEADPRGGVSAAALARGCA